MATYTQAERPITVSTVLGEDVLLLQGYSGEEGISTPFSFTLDLLSTDASIDPEQLLRSGVLVTTKLANGDERPIHGLISRFTQLGRQDELVSYRAQMVPWLWFLSLSSDCKVFQNLTVPEIVEQVFKSQGYSDFQIKCSKSYPKREFCVQYRETHLNFVTRLLEEEGIFYFFDHSDDKHMLILADTPSAVKPCPGQSAVRMALQEETDRDEDVVLGLQREHAVHTGKVTLRDYDYLQPSLKLEGTVAGTTPDEVYEYPGNYTELGEGERYARLMLEEQEAWHLVVRGQSTCRALRSGFRFDLKEHYRSDANQTYQLLSVQHTAHTGGYRSQDTESFRYRNSFVAIPHSVPFRPQRTAPRPVVQGSQTALVVGKSGEEIWVDSHGRVKIQFYWDRNGKKDENSSCWVRVASTWAGKNWGFIQIPRIGQEVIVDFIEGDPDRPIITGRVYNAEQTPPYALPGNQTQSGVKSRSSKSGGSDNFNEIRLEDKKGSEQVVIHAEKDMEVAVENDRSESVGHNETITVGDNQSVSIGKDRTESVGGNESIKIEKNRTENVEGSHSETISKNMTLSVKENRNVTVGKDLSEEVKGSMSLNVDKDSAVTVGKNHGLNVQKAITIKAGDSITIESDKEVLIKTGQASIHMKKNGDIVIKGGKIQVKGSKDLVLKGSKIAAN